MNSPDVLQPGMVFTLEPACICRVRGRADRGHVLLTADGPETADARAERPDEVFST